MVLIFDVRKKDYKNITRMSRVTEIQMILSLEFTMCLSMLFGSSNQIDDLPSSSVCPLLGCVDNDD